MELGKELFEALTTLTPMVNIDLLIKDENGRMLLSWRDDFCGAGWHIPGGVVRLGETLNKRAKETAQKEIHWSTSIDNIIDFHELIFPENKIRSHFISFIYNCYLSSDVNLNIGKKPNQVGYLKWFKKCPKNLIKVQNVYRKYFE